MGLHPSCVRPTRTVGKQLFTVSHNTTLSAGLPDRDSLVLLLEFFSFSYFRRLTAILPLCATLLYLFWFSCLTLQLWRLGFFQLCSVKDFSPPMEAAPRLRTC